MSDALWDTLNFLTGDCYAQLIRSHRILPAAAVVLASQFLVAERLPIKSYTIADGLAQNAVNRIVRDSRGFLWFCTSEGLSRFDGYTFTTYGTEQGLPHRIVTDFLETRGGEYWVGTHGGVSRFNPNKTPKFTSILPNDPSPRAVYALRESRDGGIWVGTGDGLHRIEKRGQAIVQYAVDIGMPTQFPAQRSVADLVEDHHGSLWVATAAGLYRRRSDGTSAHYTTRDGLPDDNLHCLLEDSRGQLWVGTRNAGFFRLDRTESRAPPHVAQTIVYRATDGQQTTWVYEIFETADGTLWIGTHRGILELLPGSGEERTLLAFSTRNGLAHHEITALAEDVAGNLWLGTSSAGAMKLARAGFVSYGEDDGLVGVNAIFGDREAGVCFRAAVIGNRQRSIFEGARLDPLRSFDVYLARYGRFDGRRFTWLMPEAIDQKKMGWVGERVTLRARSGEWWLGTGEALFRFPRVTFQQLKKARPIAVYPMTQVFRLFEDSRGDVWISTTSPTVNKLARWEHTSAAVRNAGPIPGLPFDDLARSFGEDTGGNVWIGFGKGLARWRNGSFEFFTARDGLPPGGVNDIHLDRAGRLWLASSASGIVRIDDPTAARPTFRKYTTAEGLSSDLVEVLTDDVPGRIYAGTGRGLDRLDPATGRIRHFTTADGLAPGRLLAAFRDRNGALWFGTAKGLSRFVPGPDRPAPPLEILVNGMTISGSRRDISALGERTLVLPDLSPNSNQLQFDFAALNFASGQRLTYEYKLEGTSGVGWSTPTDHRTINFANLSPARYKFSVRAVNSDGVASEDPATVTFTILPHIWQQWWFVSSIAIVLALAGLGAYRYRVKRLVEVANIRASIAADLHDDIGANLTRIAILSEVARRELGTDSEDGPLPSIARISRESVAAMSDIVWAINPERDSLPDLQRRMRRHAEEVFAAGSATLSFSASGTDENLKLGPVLRRDLFLIFKEAVNNAARHSGCSRVDIDLRVEGPWLLLCVADNGAGFDDAAMETSGQGLVGMRRRALKMGGTVAMESRTGGGTTIRLRVPCRPTRRALHDQVGDSATFHG